MDLFEARAKKRKTQWALAEGIGKSQSKISLIECGYVTPSEKEKSAIAKELGFKPDEIEWAVSNATK